MLLYSSDAPIGWNMLPLEVKQKFHSIAAKGDWSAHEAYDHLVPDTLKDNPDEVRTWMDGGELTEEVWTYERGAANGQYEEVTYEIPDRDVSRIEAGGDYSAENTIMEDMSINRSRGADDMTASEYAAAEQQNATDIEIIENHFDGDVEVATSAAEELYAKVLGETPEYTGPILETNSGPFIAPLDGDWSVPTEAVAEAGAEVAAVSALESVGEAIGFAAPPVILAMKAGRAVSNNPEDQTKCAGIVGTAATIGMFTPVAPVIGFGALCCTLWGLGDAFLKWNATRDPITVPFTNGGFI